MRAAAILGLGCSRKNLSPFSNDAAADPVQWRMGMPAEAEEADVIVLFGGDGTIHRHLSQLVQLGLPVLIVPAGSGNDFARALGLRRVRDSLAAWQNFRSGQCNWVAIDVGVITALESGSAVSKEETQCPNPELQHYFCSVAGIGLDSEVARRANGLSRRLRGHGGYALTVVPTAFSFAPFPLKIFVLDESRRWTIRSDQSTILAAFANSSTYGGGMSIAPQAQMDDGQLDMCVIGSMNPFKLACMFPAVYLGCHLKLREVNYFRAARVRVQTQVPFDVYADGEYICQTPVEVSIQPGGLKLLTL